MTDFWASCQQEALTKEQGEGLMVGMRIERLDHLGIVAGVCSEIGLAAYLDALAG